MKPRLFLVGILVGFIPEILNLNDGLDYNAGIVLQLMITMIFFWVTEAIPLSITALIPIIIAPLLKDINLVDVFSPYSSPVVFLLLGGFLLANGFEKSNLHQRFAVKSIIMFGKNKNSLLMCFIFITAFISMWLSNTATCLLMLPIVKFIVENNFKGDENQKFSKMLILCVAYASSIGGMMTPIGTIPNAVMIGFLAENFNLEISFIEWVFFISPLSMALLFILWLYLSLGILHKNEKINQKKLKLKYESLGKFSNKEKVSLFILILAALLWIFKIKINNFLDINLNDSGIALFSAILFFILPVNKKMDVILGFDWFKNIPWNVLILFGGGLSMASLVMETGLANELSKNIVFLNQLSLLLIIFILTFLTSLFTEFTSNTATTFLLLPLLGTFAINSDINVVTVILPVVLAASCAFMMPISTPPNAIVFSTNQINISFMIKTGFVMNIISILMISFYVYFFGLSFFN